METSEAQNKLLAEFMEVTQESSEQALNYLTSSKWDIEDAMSLYYRDQNADSSGGPEEHNAPPASSPAPNWMASASSSSAASTSAPKQALKPNKRFATLADLSGGSERASSPSHSDDEPEKNFFTGGEKSGLAVQNPYNNDNSSSTGNKLVADIIKRAQENRRHPDDSDDEDTPARENNFQGTGYRLGSDQVPSVAVPDPYEELNQHEQRLPRVSRTLTFWRDGFSVEDSPLYRYDDPANTLYLKAIEQGTAPLSILNAQQGQGVDVHVVRKLDEDYQPPKRKIGGFQGHGQRLGSPVPGERTATPSPAVTPTPAAATTSSSRESSLPAETGDALVQLQLSDGSRHRRRFEASGPVQQLYDFVGLLQPSQTREYILQTTFPMKKLDDKTKTLKEAGVVGAVVVQRWV